MANVVRDPHEHPEAIITRTFATNKIAPFKKEQVAFVYGSIWKQRYFGKERRRLLPSRRAVGRRQQSRENPTLTERGRLVVPFFSGGQQATADGPSLRRLPFCSYTSNQSRSRNGNVGCERCTDRSEHAAHPTRTNIVNLRT